MRALYLIVLLMSIGPIVSVRVPSLGNINIVDIFLGFLILFFFLKHIKTRIYLGPFSRSVKLLAILFVISVVLCGDYKAVAVSALNIVQFTLVYLITINTIKTRRQAKNLVVMIALGVMVGAALHLVFYARGLSLWLTSDSPVLTFLKTGEIGDYFAVATTKPHFYRTSHFYGSFIVPCGAAIVLAIASLCLNGTSSRWYKIYWGVVIGVSGASLLVTGNRTVLLSCAISLMGFFAMRLAARRIKSRRHSFLPAVCLIFLCIGGAFMVQRSLLSNKQKVAYSDAIFGAVHNSLGQRFSMWSHASYIFMTEPKIFLFGIGPDLAWRSPDNAKVAQIMFIPAMKSQVPSYHNFYFDLVLNFGFMFFLVFLGVIVGTTRRLIKTLWHTWDEISGVCLCVILMWLISWFTVSMMWGKVLLVLSQLLALAHLVGFGLLADNNHPLDKAITALPRLARRLSHSER